MKWTVTLSATVMLVFLLFLLISTQGHVSGEEFAPTHFQLRKFSFYEIPVLHIQITPIRRSGSTPPTATYVRQTGLIRPQKGVPTTWHLGDFSRGVGSAPGDAQLLLEQLKLESGGDGYWRSWSVDHPARAKIFWPIIQKLAQRELYVAMPPLFELAQLDLSPQQLRQRIDQNLIQQYVGLIQDMKASGRAELAEQLLAEALADYPDRAELQSLRPNESSQ